MKIIDAQGAVMGRVASYAAKEALKGEEITILNCEKAIISGNKEDIKQNFLEKRQKVGTLQVGPKVSGASEKYFKRVIKGMLPNPRAGRGREASRKIMCYKGIPEKFKDVKIIPFEKEGKIKFLELSEITR